MISKFVYKTSNILYHSILQKELPVDSDNSTLEANLFCESQNNLAIKNRLSENPEFLNLIIIPTWECNLRCTHCCVLSSLKKKDDNEIHVEKLEKFLENYFQKFTTTKRMQGYFLGGESLLYPEKILKQISILEKIKEKYKIDLSLGVTTNLAFKLNIDHIKCFEKLDTISVSLDGMKSEHNNQRFAFVDKKIDPYEITTRNLAKLVLIGLRDKISVQAALDSNLLNDYNYIKQYYKSLTKIGIKIDKIIFGSIFPTKQKPEPQKVWLNYKKESFFIKSKPCCKYKFMSNIQVNPDNTIYDNFYSKENSYLGNLDDDIEVISQRYTDLIFNHMPALQDKNCLNCSALGYCWGGCIAGHVHIGNRPSLTCNQKKIVPYLQELASENKLLNYKEHKYLKNLL